MGGKSKAVCVGKHQDGFEIKLSMNNSVSQNLGNVKRSQYWSFILYEESVIPDYIEYLKDEQVSFALSPWHDKDTWSHKDESENTEHKAGTPKKKHRHGVLFFSSLKSYEQVKEITDKIHAPRPERCRDVNKSVQYFIHKNDPEKYQYSKSDIYAYAVDVEEYFISSPTLLQKKQYLSEMRLWAKENNITRMNDLIDEALDNRQDTWACLFNESPRWAIEKYINGQWQANEATKKNSSFIPQAGDLGDLVDQALNQEKK